ncbi:MAG: efflux RND transporter periplasmic adaptor subunit [Saprospiraceae bacterium]
MEIFNKKFFWLAAIFSSLLIFACGGGHENISDDVRPTVQVKLAKAGGVNTEGFVSLSGKIQAEESANISARIMGYLINVPVKVGDQISKGQLLATISSDDIKAKIAQADAGILEATVALKNIEKDYSRIKNLFEKKSATQKELDDITAYKNSTMEKLKQAEAMKNEVNAMLSYATIKSPFSGVITEKFVNTGDMANPGMPLFTIEAGDNYQAVVMVPESQISSIKKGEKVKVIIKSNGEELNGVITEYSSSSLNTGGQYLTKIDLDKKEIKGQKLFSGMYIHVLMPEKNKSREQAKITVNKNAVVEQGQLTGIFTLSDKIRPSYAGYALENYGDQIEVLSGLVDG